MSSKRLTPEMQRRFLLLVRYLQALEAGELEVTSTIVQAAEHDAILERMIVEVDALSQATPAGEAPLAELAGTTLQLVPSSLAWEGGEQSRSNPGQGRQISRPLSPMVKTQRKQRSRPIHRFISGLAAVLVGVLLVGGFLAFLNLSRSTLSFAPGTRPPLGQTIASPIPTQAPYACGAWATNSSPAYVPNGLVWVYAKFVQNVDGHPVGMNNASALATAFWPPDATTSTPASQTSRSAHTTSDGLAVFSFQMQPGARGHVVQVEVLFTSADGQHTCSVTRANHSAAFFTAISGN